MRSMENNMIKSTTIWGIFNPRSYYVAQARFSQDIPAQSCFYFNGVDICFEKNNVLWKCQHARRSMIQCMDAMTYALRNYAHGVLHWLWCAGHDAWLMVHMLECMLATQKVMQVPTIFVGPNQNPSQHNIQVMENRLPWSRYRGSRYQHAPSGTSVWLQHTRGPRFRRGTIGQWWTPR